MCCFHRFKEKSSRKKSELVAQKFRGKTQKSTNWLNSLLHGNTKCMSRSSELFGFSTKLTLTLDHFSLILQNLKVKNMISKFSDMSGIHMHAPTWTCIICFWRNRVRSCYIFPQCKISKLSILNSITMRTWCRRSRTPAESGGKELNLQSRKRERLRKNYE